MPVKCCIPNCRGNYDEKEKVSVFQFPKDEERRLLWRNKIPRDNFVPHSKTVVCERHFVDQFIVRIDSVKRPDGSVLSMERDRPKLTANAYPSIFPNCPSYLSSVPLKRKAPDDRRSEMFERDDKSFTEWLNADKIIAFSQFCDHFKSKVDGTIWMYRLCGSSLPNPMPMESDSSLQYWSFYRILDSPDTPPRLMCAVKIFTDLHVEIYTDKIERIPNTALKWIFGDSSPPTLQSWSQFDTLMSHFASDNGVSSHSFEDKINTHVTAIQDMCCCNEDPENEAVSHIPRYLFLTEQMKLVHATTKRYTSETLLWAFQIFARAPRLYAVLRRSLLTLPHPSYLRKLSSVFNIKSGLDNTCVHLEYMRQKSKKMSEQERNVILMLDEIHISSQLSYKSGRFEGSATNCQIAEANTAQVFMISSVFCKTKDVVAIVPVKNINASYLQSLLLKVLELLHKSEFHVLCVISDNNRINRNAFTIMSGGKLQPSIPNPVAPNERLFILFDTVHLFKCIRNNWLGQKDVEKTFMFPTIQSSSDPSSSIMRSSFSHIIKLYREECTSPLKLAPRLNMKCLNPTSTERQNVNLMLRVFDRRNVTALEHFDPIWKIDTSGTRAFLTQIIRLWSVLNVKHPFKGIRLRDDNCKPVTSTSDQNMHIIQHALQWLADWEGMGLKPREGTLSRETMDALHHTLSTFVELIKYLLHEKNFKYVLLGKFQTDDLEFRFSQYRQMSGCNYHISVQQVLEGEKKLKLLSVLKLVSASNGSLKLKDITEPLVEVTTLAAESREEDLHYFLPLISACDEIEMTNEQLKALIFVSGYCAKKALGHLDCDTCKSDLHTNQRLQVEVTEDCFSYLSALDRGGLTWPSDYAVQIVTEVFKVFQLLVKDTNNEVKFLSCTNQKHLLLNLALERLTNLGLLDKRCDQCDTLFKEIASKCCAPAVNIFLNNYSKLFSDSASSSSNARKVKTFSKRS